MKYYFFLFFGLFFTQSVRSVLVKEHQEKTLETENKEEKVFIVKKEGLSYDMTHNHFETIGYLLSFNKFSFFTSVYTVLYSNTYSDGHLMPTTEYSFSLVRNAQIECGFMYEFIPFYGFFITIFTKEFFNNGSVNLGFFSGGRAGFFYHISRLFIEGGLLLKEGHSGLSSFKNYGISVFVSLKFKKDCFFVGGGIVI